MTVEALRPTDVWEWRRRIWGSTLHANVRHVLTYLSLRANRDGSNCYPSVRRIRDDTGLSKNTVIKRLDEAEASGWVTTDSAGHIGQGWKRTQYWPSVPTVEATRGCPLGGQVASPRQVEGGEAVAEGGEAAAEGGEATSPHTLTSTLSFDLEEDWRAHARNSGGYTPDKNSNSNSGSSGAGEGPYCTECGDELKVKGGNRLYCLTCASWRDAA